MFLFIDWEMVRPPAASQWMRGSVDIVYSPRREAAPGGFGALPRRQRRVTVDSW